MAKIDLSEDDIKLLSECVNEQKDVPPDFFRLSLVSAASSLHDWPLDTHSA